MSDIDADLDNKRLGDGDGRAASTRRRLGLDSGAPDHWEMVDALR